VDRRALRAVAPHAASLEVNVGDALCSLDVARVAGHFQALVALARALA
jgi:hypothetical protein